MDNYSSGGIGAAIVAVIGILYGAINHKRVRSNCCGYLMTASLDVEPTTPEKKAKVDEAPNNQEKQ